MRVAAAGLFTAVGLIAVLPFPASAADRQEVTWSAFYASHSVPPVTVTQLNSNRARVDWDSDFALLGSSDNSLFCCDTYGDFAWTVDLDRMQGTVSGSIHVSVNQFEPFILWKGDLHGVLTPEGASGVLHMVADTGQRFVGKWESSGPVDPTNGTLGIDVTGTVTTY
jgi:hypothetical protein